MTANTPRTKKQKGSTFEREIAKLYMRRLFKKAMRMPMSGAISNLKGDIWKDEYDVFLDECKNQETWKIAEYWKQTVDQCGVYQKPVLHIKKNFHEPLTIIRTLDYFDLRETIKDLEEENARLQQYEPKTTFITKESQLKGLKKRK